MQLFDGGSGLEIVPLCQIGFRQKKKASIGPFRTSAKPVELGKHCGLASSSISGFECQGRQVVTGFFCMRAIFREPLQVRLGVLRGAIEKQERPVVSGCQNDVCGGLGVR